MENRIPRRDNVGVSSGTRREPADRHAVLSGILRDVRKTLKNRNLYAHIEGHGAEQFTALHGRFTQLLEASHEVVLRVEVSTLHWSGQPVFDDDGRDLNLVFPLFHAGVRRLTFRRGLVEQDFIAFWSTVAAELTYDGPDDLMTRLWKHGFEHIEWLAHADIEELDDDDGAFTVQVLALGVQEMRMRPGVGAHMNAARDQLAAHYAAHQQRCAELGLGMLTDPAAARVTVETELASERQRVLIGVGRSLLDIALVESRPEAGEYLADGFEQTAIALLNDGKLAHVCALADQAAELSQRQVGELQQQALALAVHGLARAMRNPTSIAKISALCAEGTSIPTQAFQSLSRLLVAGGCEPALALLEKPITSALRTAVLKAMAQWGAGDALTVARRARSADERLALALLDVIAVMPLQLRVQAIEPTLSHVSSAVRRRALRAITDAKEPGPGATALGRHLERCEDAEERTETFDALAKHDCIESERVLMKCLQNPEQRADHPAAWQALLALSSSSSLEFARAAVQSVTRGLLGAKDEELKAALVEAAGGVGGGRAAQMLEAVVQAPNASSRPLVKRAQELLTVVGGGRGSRA